MEEYRLKISNMSKSFPGVKALDNIKLAVKPGSVHALIGENGAGKSTLMKCLFGLYHPDSGTIEIDGQVMDIKNPNDALKSGISMIHQELNPVPYRNVVDNIWAGRFQTKGIVVDENQMMEKTRNLLRDLDFDMDVTTFAKNLSVSQMQAIEIAKAVSYNAKIIIMDEPTSSLTVAETQHLFKIIGKLRKEGRSIIYISHKLEEIFEIADEITVMRDGQYIGTWDIKDITIDQLIGQMVGRKMDERFPVCGDVRTDEVMLRVENFTSAGPRSFKNVSFDLHKGEILGFGGLSESGMHEIGKAIFGASYDRTGKVVLADGTEINDIPTAIKHSIAYTSKDRDNESVVLNQSIGDNICLPSLDDLANKAHMLNDKKLKEFSNKFAKQMSVKMVNVDQFVSDLSGGNKQKVVLARWIGKDSDIVVLDSPTRGIDIKVKQDIYQLMNQMRKNGKSIIMISEELMELIGMCDRIIIMKDGKLSGELERSPELDENSLITMMV